jgi:DNA invertase Pin-like site-specific DNA recombinase
MSTYAYIRFSNEEQSKGDSLRRQIDGAKSYARSHRLPLTDKTIIQDLGLSAYDGTNITRGALGKFLKQVQAGKIEHGSTVIVENLDRLSRQGIRESGKILNAFLDHGIDVHTWADGQTYIAKQYTLAQHIMSAVQQDRAHKESEIKSLRVRQAWNSKREKAKDQPIGGRVPGWLSYDKNTKKFVVDKERTKVVRRIFQDCTKGIGNVVIVKRLNEDGIKPFGSAEGWRTSAVAKILANRAVLGEYQPHEMVGEKRQKIGEPIKGYFPAIIDEDLFYQAEHSRKERLVSDHPRGGRTGKNYANLFHHVATCAYCGGPMMFEAKGNGRNSYLVCSNARRGRKDVCSVATSWRYDHFETSFLSFVEEVDLASIMNADGQAKQRAELQAEIASLKGRLGAVNEKQQAAFQLLAKTNVDFVAKQLTSLEQESKNIAKQIADKGAELASLQSNDHAFKEVQDMIAKLQGKGDLYALHSEVASKLRSIIESVIVAAEGDPDESVPRFFNVKFKNGDGLDINPDADDPSKYQQITEVIR